MRRPSYNRVTLAFGATTDPYTVAKPHKGVDFSHSPDPYIYAPEAGIANYLPGAGTCGNNLQISGATGRHGFCHLSEVYVKTGDRVSEGQKVGKMGDTGYAFGVHLHWVLSINGVYVDPLKYVMVGGDMDRIKQLEQLANYRQDLLNSIGAEVSVKTPVDGNSVPQIITNIRTLYKLINDKDKEIDALKNGGGGTVLSPGRYIVK